MYLFPCFFCFKSYFPLFNSSLHFFLYVFSFSSFLFLLFFDFSAILFIFNIMKVILNIIITVCCCIHQYTYVNVLYIVLFLYHRLSQVLFILHLVFLISYVYPLLNDLDCLILITSYSIGYHQLRIQFGIGSISVPFFILDSLCITLLIPVSNVYYICFLAFFTLNLIFHFLTHLFTFFSLFFFLLFFIFAIFSIFL